jgi:hypothetical protein
VKVEGELQAQQTAASVQIEEHRHERVELEHWTAQGLHKLGYTLVEGRRMAAHAPDGLTLEQMIQWCLRQRGAKK